MALLGEAFVRVRPDTDGFEREASSKIGGGLRKVAGAVTAAFGAIKVGGFLKGAIGEASSYNETVSKTANIFGAQIAPEIQRFAKTAPAAFGISETAALSATAQFGNMFTQLGFTSEAAASASTNLIQTAADLGSFNNVDPTDVLERVGASLRGEFDSLQQLIPNINAARVEQEALAATGKETAKQLTAQEKATATLAIIQRDGALAANDFAETSGGLANQQRILAATVDGLQQRLGQALLPAVTAVTTYLASNAEPAFNRVSQAVNVLMLAFRTGEVGTFSGSLGVVSEAGARARDVFDTVKEAVGQFIDRVQDGDFSGVGTDLSSAADSAGKLGPVVADLAAMVPSFSDALGVASTVLRVAADNADVLADIVPILAAGFVALKVAQLASNVAAVVSIPLRIAEVAAQRALTQSIAAQTAALAVNTAASGAAKVATAGTTGATVANTAATNTSALARARETIATVAGTVAKGAATVATAALSAATTVLGVAIRFAMGPVGLIITGIGLLAAGLVLAYQKSETFRNIVNGALDAVKSAFTTLLSTALGVVDGILGGYQSIAEAAGRLPGPLGAPFRAAAEAIEAARSKVGELRGAIDALPSNKSVKVQLSIDSSALLRGAQTIRQLEQRQGDGPGRAPAGSALSRVMPVLNRLGGYVTSTYRSPARNRAVGGSPTSYHLDRNNPAVDIAGPAALLDRIHSVLRSMGGWRELIWRAPGHYDHIHAADRGGIFQGPGMVWMGKGQETFASGLAAKKVAELPRGGGTVELGPATIAAIADAMAARQVVVMTDNRELARSAARGQLVNGRR